MSIPLGFLGSVYREVRQALLDMKSMFVLMNIEPNVQNKINCPHLAIDRNNSTIEFRNVAFQYETGKPIFTDLSFTIPSGKKIAFVGGSGSGYVHFDSKLLFICLTEFHVLFVNSKSSMIRLLYRFFEPQAGSIYIGGQNINDVDLDSLRKSIAIVPQVGEFSFCCRFVVIKCQF